MKYEKLIFIYPFNVGSFLNAKAGLEATLEEGDNLEESWDKLTADVKRLIAKEQGIVSNGYGVMTAGDLPFPNAGTSPMTPFVGGVFDHKDETRPPSIEFAITNAGSIKELELYEKSIDQTKEEERKRQLWLAYDKRFTELSNQLKQTT